MDEPKGRDRTIKLMKFLPPSEISDVANLLRLSRNQNLGSYPELKQQARAILRSYISYRKSRGNPKSPLCPAPLSISQNLKDALRRHYSHPPKNSLEFIEDFRSRGSPNVCPMCGSPKTGSIDHLFPQGAYAEFSIFSINLVPACDCNTKRQDVLVGDCDGERVFHPYFDAILAQRLVSTSILSSPEHGFNRPLISLKGTLQSDDDNFSALEFHIKSILHKTNIIDHLNCSWINLIETPKDYIWIPTGLSPISVANLGSLLQGLLGRYDRKFGTPNNWDSILISGLVETPEAIDFLLSRI